MSSKQLTCGVNARKMTLFAVTLCSLAAAAPAQTTLLDGSGIIVTGGTSQQVFAYNPRRRYLLCQNPLDATEKLTVNVDGPAAIAAASIELAPGGSLTIGPLQEAGSVPAGPVNVNAATTGHRFVCKQM